MNLNELRHIYFIGIGGIGMSALAKYFMQKGIKVSGYDKTETRLTKQLAGEGIDIFFEDEIIPVLSMIDLVVYTPAIPKNHQQFNWFLQKGVPTLKRAELLGKISENKFTIAVAGTHGKTTITSLIAHIFNTAGVSCSAFVGGIAKNYQSNFIGVHDAKVIIAEADEYDRSFLKLNPDIAVVSSVDADHLDIYHSKENLTESFRQFVGKVKTDSGIIVNGKLKPDFIKNGSTYGLKNTFDYYPDRVKIDNSSYYFNIQTPDHLITGLRFLIPGRHNLENMVAAVAVAKKYGIDDDFIREALLSYKGVERRFDVQLSQADCIYIDDYAHHPEELKACITAVREFFPGRKITGIFQPHLFSRTRDFADEFARSLECLDELILLEIYPAREEPINGINALFLLDKVELEKKYFFSNEETIIYIKKSKPEVLLTLGAGNIDRLIEPIKESLINK